MNRISFRGAGKLLAGYTIVEVTLFLAISGGILIASTSLLSGREERIRFTQTVSNLEVELRDIFNDTSTGFFPSNSDFECSVAGTGPSARPDLSAAGSTEQGGNTGCIFVGKLLTFINNNAGANSFDGDYEVYTLVGTKDVTEATLSENPIPFKILASTNAANQKAPGVLDRKQIPGDVVLTTRLIDTATNQSYNSIAVLSDFGDQSGIGFSGNAARVKLYGYTGRPYHNNNGLVGAGPRAEFQEIVGPLVICLNQDNISGRPAAIIINKQLTVERLIDEQPDECSEAAYRL